MFSGGLTLHCNSSLELLHGNTCVRGYFVMSAQIGEEGDGAVGCSEPISSLMALRSWGGGLVVLGLSS